MSEASTVNDRELVLERVVAAPRERLFEGWTDPQLLAQWFAPAPLTTTIHEIDPRPGGAFRVTMRDPNGAEYPASGVYLEIVKNERIVTTDAYERAWQPSAKPFMTAIITFEDSGPGRTKYTARALHWTSADREEHEKMGFHQGWSQCLDQLVALVNRG
ncbi:MAG TPA: SRPBCC family protein [Tepidisphaeraceae bacterium]|nr:SRPBCC family protein [Tepidisphaeraceae bacterium]